jgi:hypothetical protein
MADVEEVQHPILILFEVDGCLISTGGAGARAWHRAFETLYGVPADIGATSETGMTDPDVGRLTFASVLGRELTDRELSRLLGTYLDGLADEVAHSPGYRVMPGVQALLPRLVRAGVLLGIVSGALVRSAILEDARLGQERYRARGTPTIMLGDGTKLRHPIAYPQMRGAQVVGVKPLPCHGEGCIAATRDFFEHALQSPVGDPTER